MSKVRLDHLLVAKELVASRSQAESYIKLGKVIVNGRVINKPGFFIADTAHLKVEQASQYVSRAGMKLESVAQAMGLSFVDKIVLDVGSSTGGFTDYALRNGAKKVVAVDVGTDQMHPSLRGNPRVELYEKTDIRDFKTAHRIDIVVIDVSFISMREILPSVRNIVQNDRGTLIVAMLKPQFEAGKGNVINGVVKNNAQRRQIIRDFETWLKSNGFYIGGKKDSEVKGAKGNQERFYALKITEQ
jgi:23S rRNA (cytidine1920-2'-O)/16S rRNA (cytidine1409-2'-O)-methyltransferase